MTGSDWPIDARKSWSRRSEWELRAYLLLLGFAALGISGCGSSARQAPSDPAGSLPVSEAALRSELRGDLEQSGLDAGLLQAIAASYWRSGHRDSAQVTLERALTVDPGHVQSLTWLSRLYYESNDVERGIELLSPIVAAEPGADPELVVNLAVLEMAWGNFDEAQRLLERSTTHHPSYGPAWGNLGYLYMQLDDVDAARTVLVEAVDRDPDVPEFHNNLGIVYRRSGDFERAALHFAKAIDAEPKFREAHHNLALLYKLYLFDDGRAREHFRMFIALGGNADSDVTTMFRLEEPTP